MNFLFWFCWVVDLLILLVCLYETFAVSSNSSLALPAFLMAVLLAGSWWFRASSPRLALVLAGLPAGLLLLFALFFVLFSMGNNKWN